MLRLWPWKRGRGRRRQLHPMSHALSAGLGGDDKDHIWTGVDEDDCLKVLAQLRLKDVLYELARFFFFPLKFPTEHRECTLHRPY